MIYNVLLCIFALCMCPKIVWQMWKKGKKMPSIGDRFGLKPPISSDSGTKVWIHAVSLGEMKAVKPLTDCMIKNGFQLQLLITTSTATGYEEACRLFSTHAQVRYLPLDFSWTMRRWARSFRPNLLIFMEGDIWLNLLREVQKLHAKTALVSGKVSEKSAKRFRMFRFFSRQLFDSLDLLCVQSDEYRGRFEQFVKRPIQVSGNLKLDIDPLPVDVSEVRRRFSLSENQKAITLSCTHAPEERELIEALSPLWKHFSDLVIFLAPRHPERFGDVALLLHQMKIPFCRWNENRIQEPIVLVDTMGQLPMCYSVSSASIVAGSFSSRRGGHNILEPCLYGCPVLFGPYIYAQKELSRIALQYGVGCEVSEEMLVETLLEWFEILPLLRSNALRLIEKNRGSADRTWQMVQKIL